MKTHEIVSPDGFCTLRLADRPIPEPQPSPAPLSPRGIVWSRSAV
jgi:hypothetical protein